MLTAVAVAVTHHDQTRLMVVNRLWSGDLAAAHAASSCLLGRQYRRHMAVHVLDR